jgi:hypothetical protein
VQPLYEQIQRAANITNIGAHLLGLKLLKTSGVSSAVSSRTGLARDRPRKRFPRRLNERLGIDRHRRALANFRLQIIQPGMPVRHMRRLKRGGGTITIATTGGSIHRLLSRMRGRISGDVIPRPSDHGSASGVGSAHRLAEQLHQIQIQCSHQQSRTDRRAAHTRLLANTGAARLSAIDGKWFNQNSPGKTWLFNFLIILHTALVFAA